MGLFPRRGADNARLEFRLLGGKGEGLIDFPVPISAPLGEYEIRLYSSGGYTFIGRSTPFEVLPPNVYLKALQPAVKAGGVIRVRWSGVDSPAKDDWIGVFPKSGQDTARLLFQKTGGFASGELSFGIPAGTTAGEYEFRFYSNGSWQMARTSDPFRVEATSVRLEIRPVQLKQGESLTISWTGIDYPSKDDWIGLFQNGDLAKRIWFTTLGGKPSGEIDWADSRMAPPGAYEAALFSAGGWQKLAHRALTILPARAVDGGLTGGQSPIRR
jgi:hypothetical protein